MDVVALLSPPLLSHLRITLSSKHTVRAAASWQDLDATVRRGAFDVAVVDPAAAGQTDSAEILAFRQRYPSLPLVVYTVLTPASMQSIVGLARHGVEHVVLFRFDDEPRRLLDLLERQPGNLLSERVLEHLVPSLATLSPALARAVERLFRRPHQFFGTQDLAASSGLTRRTVYRQFEAAGLASPRVVVMAARLLRAYSYMRDPGHRVEDVAEKMGYSAPRIFARHVRETIGLTPSVLRRELTPDEFVRLLLQRLVSGGESEEPDPALVADESGPGDEEGE